MQTIFSARIVYDSGSRTFSLSRERFFLVGSLWLVIMEGPSLPEQTYNHIAFQISDGEFEAYKERLTKAGVPMREARSRIPGEGRSLYFTTTTTTCSSFIRARWKSVWQRTAAVFRKKENGLNSIPLGKMKTHPVRRDFA